MLDKYREFLLKHHAHKTEHSGRHLFDHLKGVYDLLRDWDNPEHVCLAGLFHSIYGTNVFKHQSVDFKQRPIVRALIGNDAEYLVYLFCVADRPKVFLDSETMWQKHIYDHHCNQMVALTPRVRRDLVEIEAANLLEQGRISERILKRLKIAPISGAARAALEAYSDEKIY